MKLIAGLIWLIEDLANCLAPLDIPAPLETYWTDGNL